MDIRGDEGPYAEEEGERSIETPEADAAEQQREVLQSVGRLRREVPFDADPADAADQDRVVDLDDDDYR
ncbi:unnamed protein product [[Actinomadura] parvosata subsp. kistnae]|uniref:Uncharacterized protein n=2 Tax=Nonomuraea TaxID=83681 RepID=A0A1V0AM45_9ACTN|nr:MULTISPECIES: hypothetical protein [unclassified Nonomuraea]AQZ71294.1 hypothetical protein BKM31_52065 [Nonomuraea sp. ATCC 55076]NJP96917.1 hypothetical protein [Nonomuraea sp. FMUSA5-5]SPL92579.1 unnamed protein product [Actinomadura parvosata subsp. kistnae]